ncbi:MAG: hypothetical protein C5B50_10095 [Verrucomicrobia bacterium]|nr:MAG: hypothetical protein C5B50_10095 [Verrucomicrobiota bacterium]
MKTHGSILYYWFILPLLLASFYAPAQIMGSFGSSRNDTHATLQIKADGSCLLTAETTEARKLLEQQLKAWERYSSMSENAVQEDETPPAASAQSSKAEQKPMSTEELTSKYKEFLAQQQQDSAEDLSVKIEEVSAPTNSIRIIVTQSFASLTDLMSRGPYQWGPSVLMFDDARIEIDTNRNLSFILLPARSSSMYLKNMGRVWKSSKMKFYWKLVLPGKILTSGLPQSEGNATWLEIEGEKPATVDAALKLASAPLVITAEPGGLKLDEPLTCKNLMRGRAGRAKSEPDLPIAPAGPGFSAEPSSVSLSSVHHFPEAEKYLKDQADASMFGMDQPGTVVAAKLFPPKDRRIKSVSGLRIISAKDDKGRTIAESSDSGDENTETFTYSVPDSSSAEDSKKGSAAPIQLHLALPEPDAKAIDLIQAEAVALTFSGWKEMTLTNAQADAKKEIDVSEILPRAKLIIKKIASKRQQKTIEGTLEGPPAVSQLEVKVKLGPLHQGQSTMSERSKKTASGKTTRQFTVQSYDFSPGQQSPDTSLTLIVRYPLDLKRERVQFKLSALDLL